MENRTYAYPLQKDVMKRRIVLDTNCLVSSLPRKGKYYQVWQDFFAGKYTLCYTNEILTEYEEILTQKMGKMIAQNVVKAIIARPNTLKLDPHFRFQLISQDLDDNKFVDCAIVANAQYIVTEDKHFNVLSEIDFPKVDVINLDTFLTLLLQDM